MPTLNSNSIRAPQPDKITTPLKPHQLTIIKACEDFEYENMNKSIDESIFNIGVICDRVGAGKSLMCLGICSNNKPVKKSVYFDKVFRKKGGYCELLHYPKKNYFSVDKNIIIVPHPTFGQWKKYIDDDTSLKALCISGLKEMKELDTQFENPFQVLSSEQRNENIQKFFEDYDIVLISSLRAKNIASMNLYKYFQFTKFNRLFIDECDSINLVNKFEIKSEFTWYITSSVQNIIKYHQDYVYYNTNTDITETRAYYDYYNGFTVMKKIGGLSTNNEDIKTNLSFIPDQSSADHAKVFFKNDETFINESFSFGEPNIINILCKDPEFLSVVGDIIPARVLSRINAGDINGAMKMFKCEKTSEDNIVTTVCKELQYNIDQNNIKLQELNKSTYHSQDHKDKVAKKTKEENEKLKDKIKNIQIKIKENELCCICYDKPEGKLITKCCNSLFCVECMAKWMNSSHNANCPFCRTPISMSSILAVDNDKVEDDEGADKKKDKFKTFVELFNKLNTDSQKHRKILVFSDYTAIFDKIQEFFKSSSVKFTKICGASKVISNKVEKYKSNTYDVLLLNSKTCGSGLNLENTTDIIIYHSVSRDLQKQIIGRALRPGHEGELNIYKLLNASEE